MAQTAEGAEKARNTIISKYGADYYEKIGGLGGSKGHTGGFADGDAGRERARIYGTIGGRKSRRGPITEERKEELAAIRRSRRKT